MRPHFKEMCTLKLCLKRKVNLNCDLLFKILISLACEGFNPLKFQTQRKLFLNKY